MQIHETDNQDLVLVCVPCFRHWRTGKLVYPKNGAKVICFLVPRSKLRNRAHASS